MKTPKSVIEKRINEINSEYRDSCEKFDQLQTALSKFEKLRSNQPTYYKDYESLVDKTRHEMWEVASLKRDKKLILSELKRVLNEIKEPDL